MMALQAEQQQEIPHQVRTRLDLGVVNLTVRSLRLESSVTEEETYPWVPRIYEELHGIFRHTCKTPCGPVTEGQ